MYYDSSYRSPNGAIPDTRSTTKEKGDQKLGHGGRLFYWQLLLLVLVVTMFTITELLVISPLK